MLKVVLYQQGIEKLIPQYDKSMSCGSDLVEK
jgi:hypothetical protein